MSGAALAWAWERKIPMASAKFVLVAMADQTTSDLAFMALSTLCDATALDRKTVIASIARLIEWGLIEDTGERRGRTGQIPVYRLRMTAELFDNAPFEKSHKTGTVPKTEPVPKTDGNSTVFPIKQSQKRDTDLKQIQELDPTYTHRARDGDPELPITQGAQATRAMIDAGLPPMRVNPSHPELLHALAMGVTPKELADVVRECMGRGTGPPAMVYVIRTVIGRRSSAQSQQVTQDATSATRPDSRQSRQRSAIERQADAIHALRKRRGAT